MLFAIQSNPATNNRCIEKFVDIFRLDLYLPFVCGAYVYYNNSLHLYQKGYQSEVPLVA